MQHNTGGIQESETLVSHLPAINVAGNTGYKWAEWESCSKGYLFDAALLQSRFSPGKMGQSNFPHFCKHGRKETCYTEAAEVLRWQTGAAWQKRRRSCQTNCDKAKIDLGMENADTVSYMPSAEKKPSPLLRKKHTAVQSLQKCNNPAATDFLYCHRHLHTKASALIKWEPSPVGVSQKAWLFQARWTTSPNTGMHQCNPGHEGASGGQLAPIPAQSSSLLHTVLQKSP